MKKLLKRLLLFCSPILVWYVMVFITDPFEYFHKPLFGNKVMRKKTCIQVDHYRLYNFIQFKKHPKPNIIFGSSMTEHLNVKKIPNDNWANMSVGGASTMEELHIFWHVAKNNKMDSVVFTIDPFNYVNTKPIPSVTYDALEASENPIKYIMNKNVGTAAFQIMLATLKNKKQKRFNYNPKAKDAFWRFQLISHRNHFQNVPDMKWQEIKIKEMVGFCKANGIKIIPIVPIVHKDLIDLSQKFKDERFMPSMTAIFGRLYDYWYVNDYTKNRDNFGDPFHLSGDSVYIKTLWGNDKSLYRVVN